MRVLRSHGVDEIWQAMVEVGILEEFLDTANETEKDDTPPSVPEWRYREICRRVGDLQAVLWEVLLPLEAGSFDADHDRASEMAAKVRAVLHGKRVGP